MNIRGASPVRTGCHERIHNNDQRKQYFCQDPTGAHVSPDFHGWVFPK